MQGIPNSFFETKAKSNPVPFAQLLPWVTASYAKSMGSQISDLATLCIRNQKLTPDKYYQMRLFDDKHYKMSKKKKFVGLAKSREIWTLINRLNTWKGVIDDKLAFEAILRGFGFPTVKSIAIISNRNRNKNIENIASFEDFQRFLSTANYPVFGKPLNSQQSLGSLAIDKSENNFVVFKNGQSAATKELYKLLENTFMEGYLFQETLIAHPDIKPLCGDAVATVRIVTLNHGNGPEPYKAVMKIIGGKNVADNFWREGNLLAPVVLENGVLGSAITDYGADGKWVDSHPDNGHAIKGYTIPHWNDIVLLATEAAALFETAPLLGWDIAITRNGPAIVETNYDPHLIMLQTAHRKGVWDEKIQAALAIVAAAIKANQKSFDRIVDEEKEIHRTQIRKELRAG